ncbi:MAG: hypothetical protein ABIM83_01945, partial [candidate division WOR-3 bacterium]
SQKSSIFYDNTFIFKENPFFYKRENSFSLYFEHFSYDWKVIIGNGEPSVYRENYTQYLFYSSFYKKFVFTEFTYSKEGDFKNEIEIAEVRDGIIVTDTIKLISTIFTAKTSFLLPFKKYQLFLNGKIFYYSHPLLDVYKKYYSKDSIVYKFKKYAFCTDIGIGINLNENIYLFSLIENILKTKLDYFIPSIFGVSFIPVSNLPFTTRLGINYNQTNFKILFLISHFLFNKFGGSEVFVDEYIRLKPELSFIINYKNNKNYFGFSLSNKFYLCDLEENMKNIIEIYLGYIREIKKIKLGGGIKFDTRFIEIEKNISNGNAWISPLNIFLTFYF